MLRMGFERRIPVFERPRTVHASDRAACDRNLLKCTLILFRVALWNRKVSNTETHACIIIMSLVFSILKSSWQNLSLCEVWVVISFKSSPPPQKKNIKIDFVEVSNRISVLLSMCHLYAAPACISFCSFLSFILHPFIGATVNNLWRSSTSSCRRFLSWSFASNSHVAGLKYGLAELVIVSWRVS
jgi:hypothetical protein